MTNSEVQLIEAAKNGKLLDFWNPAVDREPYAAWGEERTITTAVIIDLCLSTAVETTIHPKGIRIRGARIMGSLDLEAMNIGFPLSFERCWFEEQLVLEGTAATTLRLSGSRIPGVLAERLSLKNSLYIDKGFVCEGEFLLRDATILGSINGETATFRNAGNNAFNGVRLRIGGGIFLRNANVFGQIRLIDAQLEGSFSCQGCLVENVNKSAIDATRAIIKGGVFFNKDFNSNDPAAREFISKGMIDLFQIQIGGSLEFKAATLENGSGTAVRAIGIMVKGAVLLTKGVTTLGTINLSFSNIGNTLECTEAVLINPGKEALLANELNVGSNVIFGTTFKAEGTIFLRGANIGGGLTFSEGSYIYENGFAIDATRANVRQGIYFEKGFTAHGGIRLVGARAGGGLEMLGITIERKGNMAFDGSRITIGGNARLDDKTRCVGEFRLNGAKIGAEFAANGSHFLNDGYFAFNAENLVTGADLSLEKAVMNGKLWLRNAEIGADLRLFDLKMEGSRETLAINAAGITIKGSVYAQRVNSKGSVSFSRSRIRGDLICSGIIFEKNLLEEQKDNYLAFEARNADIAGSFYWQRITITPKGTIDLTDAKTGQLYDDLKSWPVDRQLDIENFVYGTFGTPLSVKERLEWLRKQRTFSLQPYEHAVKVLRLLGRDKDARKVAREKQNDLRRRGELDWGGRWRNRFMDLTIGHGYQMWRVLLIGLFFVGLGGFIFQSAYQSDQMMHLKGSEAHPEFQAFMYSLDAFLPIVDLHQKAYWLPFTQDGCNYFFMIYLWIHICLGWLLTTLAIAGLTGIVKKD